MASNWDFAAIGVLGIVAYLLIRRDVISIGTGITNVVTAPFNWVSNAFSSLWSWVGGLFRG